MRRWMPLSPSIFTPSRRLGSRFLSTAIHDVTRFNIQSRSTGSINLDFYNTSTLPSSNTLLLYLPPYSTTSPDQGFQPPSFCQDYPTAVINYRWAGFSPFHIHTTTSPQSSSSTYLGWPTPLHDVFEAYSWILSNLESLGYEQMDIFVYGSYLGASLATSLALTECYRDNPVAIRGCIAYNGIYDWTMSLRDNSNHRTRTERFIDGGLGEASGWQETMSHLPPTPSRDADYHLMERNIEQLFGLPQHVFDTFASPCLLFHSPSLLVPPDFDSSAISISSLSKVYPSIQHKALKTISSQMERIRGSPRPYPPQGSRLLIPETLLLYTEPPQRLRSHRKRDRGRTFKDQAMRLAEYMRQAVKFRPKQMPNTDDKEEQQMGILEGGDGEEGAREEGEGEGEAVVPEPSKEEMKLREDIVQTYRVQVNPEMGELGDDGNVLATEWLENFALKPPPDDRNS
ncbi:hypothetical protein F4810DRAFT_48978 [Camillea tinctor]|nr:hypothetical protein F4810DRAFT_48978 [Camillea tinctor]